MFECNYRNFSMIFLSNIRPKETFCSFGCFITGGSGIVSCASHHRSCNQPKEIDNKMEMILIYLPSPWCLTTSGMKHLFASDLGVSMRHTCMCVRHPSDDSSIIQVLKLRNNAASCRGSGSVLFTFFSFNNSAYDKHSQTEIINFRSGLNCFGRNMADWLDYV